MRPGRIGSVYFSGVGERVSVEPPPSRKRIRREAKVLRDWWHGPDSPPTDAITDAWIIVSDFRSTFQRPLDKVTIQLRRFVEDEVPGNVVVAQRLKRLPTILGKLGRQPTMDITRMQDIGGCRAVLPSQPGVDRVLGRIGGHWKVTGVFNYVESPKPSGYRAIHTVVTRDDRMIEIQLRTQIQHEWAVAVERAGSRLGQSVKDGEGPADVLRYFQLASKAIALSESGEPADEELMVEFTELAPKVRGLLTRTA